jgi:hypothetical protein
MRGQNIELTGVIQLFLSNLWFILLLLIIGVENIKYFANPQGNYFIHVFAHCIISIFFLWKPLTITDLFTETNTLLPLFPPLLQDAFSNLISLFLLSNEGILFLGIVNLFKVLAFIILWMQILQFIWAWYNVLKR